MARARSPLQILPGVGPSIAGDLEDLGFREPTDLRGRDPQVMYDELIRLRGAHQDRCVLYVFRCAVYYASTPNPQPELCQWWNHKDGVV